jgi:hypothetical protein
VDIACPFDALPLTALPLVALPLVALPLALCPASTGRPLVSAPISTTYSLQARRRDVSVGLLCLCGGLYGMKKLGAWSGSVRSNATRTSWSDDEAGVGRKKLQCDDLEHNSGISDEVVGG